MIGKMLRKLGLFGGRSIDDQADWTDEEWERAEEACAEVIRRTWETGEMHTANRREDGSWEIQRVGGRP